MWSGPWPVQGAALLASRPATLALQFGEYLCVCGLEGDHLAQITIQQSLLISPCKTGCVREDCKGARGTRAFMCAHNDVWAIGLAFTVMLVFFPFLWSDFCEEQVCLHACDQLVHELDREVDIYVVDREVRLAKALIAAKGHYNWLHKRQVLPVASMSGVPPSSFAFHTGVPLASSIFGLAGLGTIG